MAPRTAADSESLKTNTDTDPPIVINHNDEMDARAGIQDDDNLGEPEYAGDDNRDPEPQAREKRVVDRRSPADAKRDAIVNRFKRPDTRPFDGDLTRAENLVGEIADEVLEPDPNADEPGVSAEQRAADQARLTDNQKPPQPLRKMIIRGQVVEMSEEDVLKAAQKTLAADSYLDDARRILEEAKEIKAERSGRGPHHPEGETQTQDDGQSPDRTGTDGRTHGPDLKGLVEKLQFGDPDEAAKALGEVIAQQASDVASKVSNEGHVNRLIQNDLAKSQAELKVFRAANPDLDADPRASRLIEQEIYDIYREEIRKAGMDEAQIPKDPKALADWHRFYRVHGHDVSKTSDILNKAKDRYLSWRGDSPTNQKPAPQRRGAPNVQVNVDRTERRQAIPQQPTRAVAPRRDAAPATSPEQSRKAAVQEMRKQRGQVIT